MNLAEAIEIKRLPRVESLTSGCTAVITSRLLLGDLCDSIAMNTGNGSYGEAVREGYSDNRPHIDGSMLSAHHTR
jgi:hypothetical protein